MADWIRAEIANGLQALLSLRLKNTPAEDMIELTADIWVQAFLHRLGTSTIECIDGPRIREGFRRIFGQIREWPAPIDVIERMPARPEREQLPPPQVTPEQHRENVTRVKGMFNDLLKSWGMKSVAQEGLTTEQHRERVEALKVQAQQLKAEKR